MTSLELQLGSSPVSSLRVVADGVVGLQSNPLRYRPVLLQLLGQTTLQLVRLVGGLR